MNQSKGQKAWGDLEKTPSSKTKGPTGPQRGFCPSCNGALWIVKCPSCDNISHSNCPKCGDLGCNRPDCPSRRNYPEMVGAVLVGGFLGFLSWMVLALFLNTAVIVPDARFPLYVPFNEKVTRFEKEGDLLDYKSRVRVPDPAENNHPYGLILRNLLHLLGPGSSGEVTFKGVGLRPIDFLDLLYGHLIEGDQINLGDIVGKMEVVHKGEIPRPGDLMVYHRDGTLFWGVVVTSKGSLVYVADEFERASLYDLGEQFWNTGQIAVLRPPDSPPVQSTLVTSSPSAAPPSTPTATPTPAVQATAVTTTTTSVVAGETGPLEPSPGSSPASEITTVESSPPSPIGSPEPGSSEPSTPSTSGPAPEEVVEESPSAPGPGTAPSPSASTELPEPDSAPEAEPSPVESLESPTVDPSGT